MLDFANISIIYDFFSFSLSRPFDTDGGATDPRRNAASGNAVLFIFLTRITNANLSFCEALRKPEFKCKHKGGMFDKLFFFFLFNLSLTHLLSFDEIFYTPRPFAWVITNCIQEEIHILRGINALER